MLKNRQESIDIADDGICNTLREEFSKHEF
jgi:hypothetical protein